MSILRHLLWTLTIVWLGICHAMAQEMPQTTVPRARIEVGAGGVYKISAKQLADAGFTDLEALRLFGTGGMVLPETLSAFPSFGAFSQPIWIQDGEVYFYAHGVTPVFYDTKLNGYTRVMNPYATKGSFVLIQDASLPACPITEAPPVSGTPSDITHGEMHFLHEKDRFSPKKSGRILFGETLSTQSPVKIDFTLPVAPQETAATLTFAYLSHPGGDGSQTTLEIQGSAATIQDVIRRNEDYSSSNYMAGIYHLLSKPFTLSVAEQKVALQARLLNPAQAAFLDYVLLTATLPLSYQKGKQLLFHRQNHSDVAGRIRIGGATNAAGRLWRIEGINGVTNVPAQGNEFVTTIKDSNGVSAEFVYFVPQEVPTVTAITPLESQIDLKQVEIPDYVIISPKLLLPEAERLAEYHRTKNNLKVLVVTQQTIFDQFSGGQPDASAYRLLMKNLYDRAQSPNYHPLLLLFGDAAYDNRKVADDWQTAEMQNTEFLLSYQSVNSTNVYSYTSDDFFGCLDPAEDPLTLGQKTQHVGIGRLPIRTLRQAKQMVDKAKAYDQDGQPGVWKSRVAFVADNRDGYSHLNQAEGQAATTERLQPALNISKIYLDAFPLVTEGGRTSVPGAKKKLNDELKKGLLLLNYTGHGGPAAWADEQILTLSDVLAYSFTHLPVWITATCDFANFDHPTTSAGEESILNPKSGAAALFTTSRVVMDIPNELMHRELIKNLLTKQTEHPTLPLGQVLSHAKNAMPSHDTINHLNFLLLGDPALKLKLPKLSASLTTINQQPALESGYIPVHAMQRVDMKGVIQDQEGSILGDFNGNLFVTVYDAQQTVKIQKADPKKPNSRDVSYRDYPGTILSTIVPVKEGNFDVDFIIPKDVSYTPENGKISLYAFDTQGNEALGADYSIRIIPGQTADPVQDTIPPKIETLFLGHPDFVSGQTVGPTPLFGATISDESGINLSGSGIGHQMSLVVDNRQDLSFVLNNYYTPNLEQANVGDVLFMLPHLQEGLHHATFTVWDIFNNVTTQEFEFWIKDGITAPILRTATFPSPLKYGEPLFVEIYNNAPGAEMQVKIELYDLLGQRIAASPILTTQSELNRPAVVEWQPQTAYGTAPQPGMYVYKVTATQPNSTPSVHGDKLLIIP